MENNNISINSSNNDSVTPVLQEKASLEKKTHTTNNRDSLTKQMLTDEVAKYGYARWEQKVSLDDIPDGCYINEGGEIVRRKGKSR